VRLVLGGCLAAALISLLLGGHPSYDPWAWIIWGREIVEGDLDTRSGPSWKPLPMLFTIPFALAGDEAAPALWLVIARAGGLLALVMTFRLGARLAGPAAGAIAALGLVLSEGFVRHAVRGFSEGLLVGLVLLAVERHLDGHRRQAFLAGLGAALLRPEVWPFWGLYGLWLAWTDPRTRALVAAGYAAIPLGWFLPEYLGSGDFLRAAARAREPNLDSAAFADRPFLAVMERSAEILSAPIYVGAAIALVLALRRRDEHRMLLACAGGAAVLMIAVGLMTEAGFAGNLRYVVLPAALVCLLAGAGWTAAVKAVPGGAARYAVAALLVAASLPSVADARREFRDDMRSVRSEWDFETRLVATIDKVGGPARLNGCGGVFTGRFQVPSVAWYLHRHMRDVEIHPYPPGWVLAPRNSSLSRDPRFEPMSETVKWIVRRNCEGA
jgi:hypothetical protein